MTKLTRDQAIDALARICRELSAARERIRALELAVDALASEVTELLTREAMMDRGGGGSTDHPE